MLLKHALPVGGDFASIIGGELCVNGVLVGRILSVDSVGRPLPAWRTASVLDGGESLVGSSFDRRFDSRFFSPIHTGQVPACTDASPSIHARASRPKLSGDRAPPGLAKASR